MSKANLQAQQHLQFTPNDLDANRRGRITDHQQSRIWWRFLRRFAYSNTIPLAVGGLLLLGAIWSLFTSPGATLLLLIGVAITLLSMGLLYLIDWMPYRKAFRHSKIEQTRGAIEYEPGSPRRPYLFRSVNDTFYLDKDEFAAFLPGKTYTVYYLPGVDVILSAEDV